MRYIVGCREIKEYNRPGHRWDEPLIKQKTDRDNLLSDWWFFEYDSRHFVKKVLDGNPVGSCDSSCHHLTDRKRMYSVKNLVEAQLLSQHLERDVKRRNVYMITEGGHTEYEIGIFEVDEHDGSIVQHMDSNGVYFGHVNTVGSIIRSGKFDPKPKTWTSEELVMLVTQNIKSENGMFSMSVVADLISRLGINQLKSWLKDHNVTLKE